MTGQLFQHHLLVTLPFSHFLSGHEIRDPRPREDLMESWKLDTQQLQVSCPGRRKSREFPCSLRILSSDMLQLWSLVCPRCPWLEIVLLPCSPALSLPQSYSGLLEVFLDSLQRKKNLRCIQILQKSCDYYGHFEMKKKNHLF